LDDVRLTDTFVNRDLQSQLDIELVRGSLFDLPYGAIVLGIFEDVDPAGAALHLDQYMGGAVTEMIERRMFDGSAGRVFVMPTGRNLLKSEQVVFMGLGRYADFVENSEKVIRSASSNTLRTLLRCGVEEFATLIFGGNSGVPIRDTVKNMIGGYLETIQQLKAEDYPVVFRRLGLCEIDPGRYAELRGEVIRFAFTEDSQDMRIRLHEPDYPATRPEFSSDTRAATRSATDYEVSYLSVRMDDGDEAELHASLLTSGGTAAVYPSRKVIDMKAVEKIIGSLHRQTLKDLRGQADELLALLFEEGFLQLLERSRLDDTHIAVIQNALASRIPWEVLLLGQQDFPALTMGVSRRHEADGGDGIAKHLSERQLNRTLNILLVVDPTEDLPGAEAEGENVKNIIGSVNGASITVLRHAEATRHNVLDALGSGEFDVMHYAGHAFFAPEDRRRSGLICAGHEVLRSRDIQQLDRLPALVFFNACESGRVRKVEGTGRQPTRSDSREQNVGIAEALLRGGVTQFIGTYWPVGDQPAKAFAEEFYRTLTGGAQIQEAVLKGRQAVHDQQSVDFADYLHFGNPRFRVKKR